MTTEVGSLQQASVGVIVAYSTRCSNCGAPLEITPDAVGYVCEHCRWTEVVDSIEKKGYGVVEPLGRDENRKTATGFLRDSLKGAFSDSQVREEKFYVIPFWVTGVSARSEINGYRTKAKIESYTVTVPGPRKR